MPHAGYDYAHAHRLCNVALCNVALCIIIGFVAHTAYRVL